MTRFALALAIVAGVTPCAAQQSATLEGTVRDASSGVVVGASIAIDSRARGRVVAVTTDSLGRYRAIALPPDQYRVTASHKGFRAEQVDRLDLAAGQIVEADFQLSIEAITEDLQVDARIRDLTGGAAVTELSSETIARVPKGRDYVSLVAPSTPGANHEPAAAGIQVHGASGAENRFFVNGMDTSHLVTGLSDQEAIVDFLDVVRVQTTGFGADQRAATGGVIQAVTKSGSNQWRGSAGLFATRDSWTGTPRGKLQLDAQTGETAVYVTPRSDDSRTFEPITDIGGPIKRSRLWAYVGYGERHRPFERTVTFFENGQTATLASRPVDRSAYWTLTGQAGDPLRGRLAGVHRSIRGGNTLPSLGANGVSFDNPALFPSHIRNDAASSSVNASLDWVVSPSTAISANAGSFVSGRRTLNASTALRHRFGTSNLSMTSVPPDLRHATGFADAPSSNTTQYDDTSRLLVETRAVTSFRGWGRHTLTAGTQVERQANAIDAGDQAPTLTLFWDRAIPGDGGGIRGPYGYYSASQFQISGDVSSTAIAVFLQDRWTPADRLTIHAGLRAEREQLPSYRQENSGIAFGFGDKLAPRLGASWDLKADGRWLVSAHWGLYYDLIKLYLAREAFGANSFGQSRFTLDTSDWPALSCTGATPSELVCPGTLVDRVDFRVPWNAPDADGIVRGIDPGLRPLRTHELTIGLEHAITAHVTLEARYVGKRLHRTVEDVEFGTWFGETRFRIVNPGEGLAEHPYGTGRPTMPEPRRDYDALELRGTRRLSGAWSLSGSYVWSRLSGNYSGLADSDEDGRVSPNIGSGFDELYALLDKRGRAVYGRLATDRPHVLKLQGTYDLPWGTQVGANLFAGSGTPLQRELSLLYGRPAYYLGRGSDGRTPALSYTDFRLAHGFRLGGGRRLTVDVTALNLFDQATPTSYSMSPWQERFMFAVTEDELASGWDPDARAADYGFTPDPRFKMADGFLTPRTLQVGLKFTF